MNPELAIRPAYDSHDMNPPAHYLLKLQVYNTSPHFGKGVISLMLLIQEGHSIRSASQSMNMAYSKAWHLIRSAEEDLGFSLIIKKRAVPPGRFGPDTGRPMPVNTIPGI